MEARELKEAFENRVDDSFAQQCKEKWAPLVEDINDSYMQGCTAVLLENEMDHLKKMINEASISGDAGQYTKFVFPIIRTVFPNLIASNICSVQPMNAPVGAVFFMQYKKTNSSGDALGSWGASEGATFSDTFSKGWAAASSETIATAPSPAAAADYVYQLLYGGSGSTNSIGSGIKQGSISLTDATTTWTDDGNGNVQTSAAVNIGTINYETGLLAIDGLTAAAGGSITITYSYGVENSSSVSQVSIDIAMNEVRADSRKLKAVWSSEAADDLRAFHGLDAEAELVSGISSEIALEIDQEVLSELSAAGTASGNTGSFDFTAWGNSPSSYGFGQADYIRGSIKEIGTLSQTIYKKTLRSPANWIVTSPETVAYLDQLPEFVSAGAPDAHNLGVMKAGALLGKYDVWTNPYNTDHKTIVGYKGSSFLDAGFIYAPYIPLQVTPTFMDPGDFSFKKGMRTRYAKKLVNNKYYGVLSGTVS